MKFLFLLLSINLIHADDITVFRTCSNAKSEFIDLTTKKTNGFKNDSMKLKILESVKSKKVYIKSKTTLTEIEILTVRKGFVQFLEKVVSGHNVLYTLIGDILTIQKSYSLLGKPVMVNTYLTCRE
jgi:hypothetical protein